MKILKLDTVNTTDVENLFAKDKFTGMGITAGFDKSNDLFAGIMLDSFYKTYLSGLTNFQAYGFFDSELESIVAFYESNDEPAWYFTHCKTNGSPASLHKLFDHVLKLQESKGRLKFYTLIDAGSVNNFRSQIFGEENSSRYSYYDEYRIPPKTKCYYEVAWELLFKRTLLPNETVVRCEYLKSQFRSNLPIGGSL